MGLNIETVIHEGVAILRLSGDLDSRTSQELKRTISRLISQEHVNFVLNMSGIEYLDTTGLGALIASNMRAKAGNGTLIVTAAGNQRIASLIHLGSASRGFDYFDTLEEAISRFN